MNCPSCGAAMVLAGNRGHFECQHCGRFHFPEPTCEGVCVLGEPTDVNCPICTVILQTALLEGRPVSYCVQCRGFLASTGDFGAIIRLRRAKVVANDREGVSFDPKELHRGVHCPKCSRAMDTHAYGGGGNAVIDSCHRCHLIWLDARELSILERYVPHVHRIEPVVTRYPGLSVTPASDGWQEPGEENWWPF